MQITWFGHSAFRLDFGDTAVLIDPFFTGNPAFVSDKAAAIKGVTHVLLTHGHGDHVGDSDIFSDMALLSEIHQPKVAIVPIGDRFTMGARTAAMAVKRFLNVETVIPCHYGTFGIIDQTADKFAAEMK